MTRGPRHVRIVQALAAVLCDPPLPAGCASPGGVVFDSIQHGANSADNQAWHLRRFAEAGGTIVLGTDYAGITGYEIPFDLGMPMRGLNGASKRPSTSSVVSSGL